MSKDTDLLQEDHISTVCNNKHLKRTRYKETLKESGLLSVRRKLQENTMELFKY